MPQQNYNFFGQAPAQMDASQSPQMLAQQMALQEFNNPTSAQTAPAQSGGGMGGINPQALAKMLMQSQPQTPTPNAGTYQRPNMFGDAYAGMPQQPFSGFQFGGGS